MRPSVGAGPRSRDDFARQVDRIPAREDEVAAVSRRLSELGGKLTRATTGRRRREKPPKAPPHERFRCLRVRNTDARRLADKNDAIISCDIRLERHRLGRSVVDDDQLPVIDRLALYRADLARRSSCRSGVRRD